MTLQEFSEQIRNQGMQNMAANWPPYTPSPPPQTYELTLGFLCWREFRELIAKQRFLGHRIDLWESSGWLWRNFVVRGDKDAVEAVKQLIKRLSAKNISS